MLHQMRRYFFFYLIFIFLPPPTIQVLFFSEHRGNRLGRKQIEKNKELAIRVVPLIIHLTLEEQRNKRKTKTILILIYRKNTSKRESRNHDFVRSTRL